MAKELPYFKFEPSEWENGNIQLCSMSTQGAFISICSIYWQRLGDLNYKLALMKICKGNEKILKELLDANVIKRNGDYINIDFLDSQLEEFKVISSKRAEAGRKGGENRVLSPEIARIRGNQIYIIHCFDGAEEFIKVGVTSESISRRFSGKMPYNYDVIFQLSTDENIDLESYCNDCLYKDFGYQPQKEFVGYLECYTMSVLDELAKIIKHRTGIAIAMPKQRNAIREEERRGDKRIEEENNTVAGKPATLEERALGFQSRVAEYLSQYPKEMLRSFYDYWTEKNEGGRKFRFEMQKVFDMDKRLRTWKANDDKRKYGNGKQQITAEGTLNRANSYRD